MTNSSKPPISSDRPIRTLAEDRLGLRETFVPRLARVAVEWPQADGLVVALDGEWGSGKTSILNMLRDYIEGQSTDASAPRGQDRHCRLVTFNPWFYDDPATLAASFFGTLAAELGGDETGPWKAVAADFKKMGRFLAAATRGISLFGLSADVEEMLAGMGKALTEGSEFAELMEQGERKLVEARRNVEKALESYGTSGGRLVIILDDVDRLARSEIVPLLRLLRIVADLPFITILVAMDQRRIREQLASSSEPLDEEYLEKMVQVTVPVPPPDRDRFSELLQEELHSILEDHWRSYPDQLTPKQYAHPKPLELLLSLIATPRDLARFGNGLRVHLLADPQPRDLDPVDAALVSAIQVFHPDLYERIRNNKPVLTRTVGFDFRDYVDREQGRHNQVRERRTTTLRGIVHGRADPAAAPLLDEIVTELFGDLLGEDRDQQYYKDEAVARRRVRTPEAFDRYFGLEGVPAVITRQEMERVTELVGSATKGGDANEVAEILHPLLGGREHRAAAEMVRDLKVHLKELRPEALRTLGEGVLLLSERLPSPVLRELLLFVLRNMELLHDRPRGDDDERLVSSGELLESAIARLPTAQDGLILLEEAATHGWLHRSKVHSLRTEWVTRLSADIEGGKDPFPDDGGLIPGGAIGTGIRLCTLAALRGEAERVQTSAEYFARRLSEEPDDLFALLIGAERAVQQRRFEGGEAVPYVNHAAEPDSATEGMLALLPNLNPLRNAISVRLTRGNLAPDDGSYLEKVREHLDFVTGPPAERHSDLE